jgi:glycerophosphoryl diester phosphodiesterase
VIPRVQPHALPRFGRPLVVGHRGASALAPENTLAAFEAALRAGADMIELDIAVTVDGEIVVIHDDDVDRTTNGIGRVCDRSPRHERRDDCDWRPPECGRHHGNPVWAWDLS